MVKDDLKSIDLNLSDVEISRLSKQKFKAIIKEKIKSCAFKYLKSLKDEHSKMKNLNYEKLELQPYLSSPIFNEESSNLIFRLRTRTVSGIKNDFRGVYNEISCPLNCGDNDTLENLLTCKVILSQYKTDQLCHGRIGYTDIFSENITKQREATEIFRNFMEIRNKILSQQVAMTGPMHCVTN